MKKYFFTLIVFLPIIVNAEWVRYAQSKKFGFVAFYDASSIKQEGDYKVVTLIKNFVKPQQFYAEKPYFKYLSKIEVQYINCDKNVYRSKRIEHWTETWAKGKMLRAYDFTAKKYENEWGEPIKSTSVQSGIMEAVCVGI